MDMNKIQINKKELQSYMNQVLLKFEESGYHNIFSEVAHRFDVDRDIAEFIATGVTFGFHKKLSIDDCAKHIMRTFNDVLKLIVYSAPINTNPSNNSSDNSDSGLPE